MSHLIGIKEFAELTGISEWGVRLLVAEGKLPFVRIGTGRGRVLISPEQGRAAIQTLAEESVSASRPTPPSGIRRIAR